MKLTHLFNEFFDSEKAGGLVLVFVTIISLLLANSALQTDYIDFWKISFAGDSLTHWINDGLMTVFFLLIGLELEREIFKGELASLRNASLPIFAAIGGLLLPVVIFSFFNYGSDTQTGAAIPMATDIAFAIGVLSLLGKRVPSALKVFLIALAVIDDLGAIIVIAIFYTKTIVWSYHFMALGVFVLLLALNRYKVKSLPLYLIGGCVMWYFMHLSGVHATITGVLLAFTIPFGDGGKTTKSYVLQHFLHKPVAFVILPIFALANTAIIFNEGWQIGIADSNSLGIILGLVVGKPLGIFLFALIGVILGWFSLPKELNWQNIIGVGFLGGIGFTMSIFVTLLAYDEVQMINNSKIAILIASTAAGLLGFIFLKLTLNTEVTKDMNSQK